MIPDMKECVKESIEEAAEHFAQSNGHVTSSRLEEMFETFESKTLKEIKTVTQQTQRTQAVNVNRLPAQAFGFQNLLFGTYEHNDRADWQVPQDFTFPASTQRRAGWDLWLKGDPSHRSRIRGEWRDTPVRPCRLMDPKHLPPKVRNVFKRSWRPIFQLMEEAPQVSMPRDPSSLDAPKINQLCDRGTQHLKSIVSYIWPNGDDNEQLNARREKWSVATWSLRIGRSQVVKRGSQADQNHLTAATRHNEPHSHLPRKKRKVTRRGFQNQGDKEEVDQTLRGMIRGSGAAAKDRAESEIREGRLEAARGRGASSRDANREQVTRVGEDAFGDAFRDVQSRMTPHQARRDQEFKEQTEKEIEDGRRAAATHRQATGDGVATDGSRLFVRRPTGSLPRNYGDNSNIGRERYAATLDSAQRRVPARKDPPPPPTAKRPPPPTAKRPPPTTTCAIEGCTVGAVQHADHKCYNQCGRVFHNMCAQMNDLCDNDNELNMYCSMDCKIRCKR
jgi:hypothetical protein